MPIFSAGHRFEVCWPDAGTVAAQVIKNEAFWNPAFCNLIGESMGENFPCVRYAETAIALPVQGTLPEPAITRPINIRPEALFNWRSDRYAQLQGERITKPAPTAIVKTTPAAAYTQPVTVGDCTLGLHREPHSLGVMQPDVCTVAAASILPENGASTLIGRSDVCVPL